jgi:hypothetical protein
MIKEYKNKYEGERKKCRVLEKKLEEIIAEIK